MVTDGKVVSNVEEISSRLAPADKHRVLVVDDEKAIRAVFQQILSYGLSDCRIDLAVNGAEAVEAFRDVNYGLILMDLHMPVMDGERAFEEIIKICQSNSRETPSVVFCTGYIPSENLKKIVSQNPLHCILQKPISNDKLLETLKKRLACAGGSDN